MKYWWEAVIFEPSTLACVYLLSFQYFTMVTASFGHTIEYRLVIANNFFGASNIHESPFNPAQHSERVLNNDIPFSSSTLKTHLVESIIVFNLWAIVWCRSTNSFRIVCWIRSSVSKSTLLAFIQTNFCFEVCSGQTTSCVDHAVKTTGN